MICFPNAKINIGLNIVSRRNDGFHNIETIFYPIGLCDALEIIPAKSKNLSLTKSGLPIDITDEENICVKAYRLFQSLFHLPSIDIYLHKVIPSGAGLGGGSSDAAYMLSQLNLLFNLQISADRLCEYASILGSDCAFFIENKPVFAYGRGELFKPINLNLTGYYIYLIKPDIFVPTSQAYKSAIPERPRKSLIDLINEPVEMWKDLIFNDFEKNIFKIYPNLKEIKTELYAKGAIYASMSGSGSSIYAIFREKPVEISNFHNCYTWISQL